MVKLSIIIVSWNSRNILLDCLLSIFQNRPGFSFEVIVVDNDPGDNTKFSTCYKFPNVTVIKNNSNSGFAVACNQGADKAKGTYLLFLNPDTIVHSGTLDNAVSFMESNSRPGVMGCRTLNSDGTLQISARKFPTLLRIFGNISGWSRQLKFTSRRTRIPVHPDYIQGSFLLIPSEFFRKLDGFDEQFFFYGEDVDLCIRVRDTGGILNYDNKSVVTHIGGGTCSDSSFLTTQFISCYYKLYRKYRNERQVKRLKFILRFAIWIRFYISPNIFYLNSQKQKDYRNFKDLLNRLEINYKVKY